MNQDALTTVPEVVNDIEFSPFSATHFVLCNYEKKFYTKISIDVYNVLMLIDGKKTIEQITLLYNFKFNQELSASFIYELLFTRLPIYKNEQQELKKYKPPEYLKLSFIIVNESILKKITPFFYWLFLRYVAILIVVLSLCIITITLVLNLDVYKHFNVQESFFYFVILMTISVSFHELGHVSAASYFGAKHGGIGGGFYLFMPVYFADVTDIWRLSKTKRIVVNVAGVYFELIFTTIVAITGSATNNSLLVMLALFILLRSLTNFNPLIRSDGYWILSDLINKPNLDAHSFNQLKRFLRLEFFKKNNNWIWTDYLLLVYSLCSCIFLFLFLYYILILNPESLIYFPINALSFIKKLIEGSSQISFGEYFSLITALLFYVLVFNILSNYSKKKLCKWKKF